MALTRVNPFEAVHSLLPAMTALQTYVNGSALDASLRELVALRASQLNGCVFCLDLHSHRARLKGESFERLMMLPAWRESEHYTAKEKAALAWTEALTALAGSPVSDEVYRNVADQLSPEELASLSVAIAAINGWNRLCAPFHVLPGALG
jgi:AhpD family alkylhydroperoxidase